MIVQQFDVPLKGAYPPSVTTDISSLVPGEKLRRVSTVEALSIAVRQRILSGAEPAGSQLREAELCARFGVSRHSLRTALQALSHEGLLVHEANRGVFVARVDAEGVRDNYRLRELLEVEAARVLSRRSDLLAPVRTALERLAAHPADTPWDVVRDDDLAFHAALVGAMGRPRTSEAFASLAGELQLAFLQIRSELEDTVEVVRQHTEIFEAVQAGDKALAVRLVRAHLRDAEQQICAALQPEA